MTLQNRVDPFGRIVADPSRGTMMGNRGGRFHRADETLGRRRWASHHWICCVLDWKGAHHEPMGDGYTSLFFLDEVTALAAGHRPCFFCRRHEAQRFLGLATPAPRADAADRIVHEARVERRREAAPHDTGELPDGTMLAIGEQAYAVRDGRLLRWSFTGYDDERPFDSFDSATLLTPALYVQILAAGYEPRWHTAAG